MRYLLLILLLLPVIQARAATSDTVKVGDCLPVSALRITEASGGPISFTVRISRHGFSPTGLVTFASPKPRWPGNKSKTKVCYVETDHIHAPEGSGLNFPPFDSDLWLEQGLSVDDLKEQ